MNKLVLLLLCITKLGYTENKITSKNERLLVTAKAVEYSLIKHNSTQFVNAPSSYKVKLENVQVIEGTSSKYNSSIEVELHVRNPDALLNYDEIYLVLESNITFPKVLYWERSIKISCIPKEMIDPRYNDFYSDNKWGRKNMKCRFVRGYSEPDEPY